MALALKPGVNETAIKYLTGQGVGLDFINAELAKPGKNNLQQGKNIDPRDYGRFLQGWKNYQTNQFINTPFQAQQYQFDPNQYLPGIEQTASSIYDPQRAQIQALSALSASQAQQTKIETKEQFAKQLQSEIEAINARGAFFGGGALAREGDIRTAETRALTNIDLQQMASQAGFMAQQAGLNAAQAQYIQQQLYESESSAYNRFINERNFQYTNWSDQRNFLYQKQQNELDYKLRIRQIENDEELTAYQKKQAKKAAKEEKKRWEEEMDYKYYVANKKSSSDGGDGFDW